MKKHKLIEIQKMSTTTGDSHAYEFWLLKHGGSNGWEPPQANPDSLREDQAMYADSQMSLAQESMGEAIEHLQGRQKEVYMLTMREGLSFAKVGKRLDISASAVQIYKTRAIKFITQYCRRAIDA